MTDGLKISRCSSAKLPEGFHLILRKSDRMYVIITFGGLLDWSTEQAYNSINTYDAVSQIRFLPLVHFDAVHFLSGAPISSWLCPKLHAVGVGLTGTYRTFVWLCEVHIVPNSFLDRFECTSVLRFHIPFSVNTLCALVHSKYEVFSTEEFETYLIYRTHSSCSILLNVIMAPGEGKSVYFYWIIAEILSAPD